jgi:hypothetical protein
MIYEIETYNLEGQADSIRSLLLSPLGLKMVYVNRFIKRYFGIGIYHPLKYALFDAHFGFGNFA